MSQETRRTSPADPLDRAIQRLTRLLAHDSGAGGLSIGDRAELRRMDPLGPALPPALWRLLTLPEVETALRIVASGDLESAERAFAIMVQAIAETRTTSSTPIGKALAETEYAEPRFVRLLRARGPEDVAFETRQAARWCAVKGAGFAVGEFCRFVLDAALDRKDADRRGHDIARDYFAAPRDRAPGAAATET